MNSYDFYDSKISLVMLGCASVNPTVKIAARNTNFLYLQLSVLPFDTKVRFSTEQLCRLS